ncbi:MAG: MoxR-like ATPase, partial [bacterium]
QMGVTHQLEAPFFVMATQNPIELEGTNPLPEAQLDRFAVKINVPKTEKETLLGIIQSRAKKKEVVIHPIANQEKVLATQAMVDDIFLPEAIAQFIAHLVSETHPETNGDAKSIRQNIRYGASPRGAIWLVRVARALALLDGRSGVGFEDVVEAAPYVLSHRVILNYNARLDGIFSSDVIHELVSLSEKAVLSVS